MPARSYGSRGGLRCLVPDGTEARYRALSTGGAGSFGVEVSGVGDDDHPVSVALGHQVVDVAFAVRPVSAITRLGSGHAPVVVHRSEYGCEIADGLHRVRAVCVLVESGEKCCVLIL